MDQTKGDPARAQGLVARANQRTPEKEGEYPGLPRDHLQVDPGGQEGRGRPLQALPSQAQAPQETGGSVRGIPNRRSIRERPVEADGKRFGDFEMDTMIGADQSEAILTVTERKTNLVMIGELPRGRDSKGLAYSYNDRYFTEFNFGYNGSENFKKGYRFGFFPSVALGWVISNESFMQGMNPWLSFLKLRGSYGLVGNDNLGGRRFAYVSTVNGLEFAAHERITEMLEAPVYFTDPYSAWQKGSIENANKLIRQYIPKGASFKNYPPDRLKRIQHRLNERPRKKLDFNTPKVEFYKQLM